MKENILKPIETAATNLRDKVTLLNSKNFNSFALQLPSLNKNDEEEDLSFIDRAKQTTEKLLTPIQDTVKTSN